MGKQQTNRARLVSRFYNTVWPIFWSLLCVKYTLVRPNISSFGSSIPDVLRTSRQLNCLKLSFSLRGTHCRRVASVLCDGRHLCHHLSWLHWGREAGAIAQACAKQFIPGWHIFQNNGRHSLQTNDTNSIQNLDHVESLSLVKSLFQSFRTSIVVHRHLIFCSSGCRSSSQLDPGSQSSFVIKALNVCWISL